MIRKIVICLLIAATTISICPSIQAFASSAPKGLLLKSVNVDGKMKVQYLLDGEPIRNQWYEYDVPLMSIDKDGNKTEFNDHRKVYLDENGFPLTGLQVIEGDTYYFGSGTMQTGVVMIPDSTGKKEKYLFGIDGKRITDPIKVKYAETDYIVSDNNIITATVDGITYDVPEDLTLTDKKMVKKDGKYYIFYHDIYEKVYHDTKPHLIKSERAGDYYAKEDGTLAANEWIYYEPSFNKNEHNWLYYGPDMKNVKGYQTINGKKYYFNKYGYLETGWKKRVKNEHLDTDTKYVIEDLNSKDKQWYYYGDDGAIKEGWVNSKDKWYYIYSDGLMATDTTIGGYYINSKGVYEK
jgi:glucan-binding YG repeat protein